MPKDNLVYVGHMIDLAQKAISFVEGLSREDFDSDELLQLSFGFYALTYLAMAITSVCKLKPLTVEISQI